jgi:O-antigen/teichoic acid export membrane protein
VAWRLLPELAHPRLDRAAVRPMLRYGSSAALIMLVGIALMNAEKFLIAGLSSAGALAYYAVAFTLARLLVVVPGAFGQVLLPAFAQLQVATDRQPLQLLYVRSLRLLLLINLPLAAVLAFSARPVVAVWAGSEYGARSAVPLAVLALGCLIDGLSFVPRVMLEAVGRPDLIARYLMLTLVPYLVAAAALIHWWGITGAAVAWTGRAAVEWALMFAAAHRAGGISVDHLVHAPLAFVVALMALLVPAALSPWSSGSLAVTVGVASLSVACYAVVTWTQELTPDERGWITAFGGRFLQATAS